MEITLDQLKSLLDDQKRILANKLMQNSHYYNCDSTEGHYKSMCIDQVKFMELAHECKYPNDIEVLMKYLPK